MNQTQLKAIYEAAHSTDRAKENFSELSQKLALIAGGAKLNQIKCLKNEKTGECLYVRCK